MRHAAALVSLDAASDVTAGMRRLPSCREGRRFGCLGRRLRPCARRRLAVAGLRRSRLRRFDRRHRPPLDQLGRGRSRLASKPRRDLAPLKTTAIVRRPAPPN